MSKPDLARECSFESTLNEQVLVSRSSETGSVSCLTHESNCGESNECDLKCKTGFWYFHPSTKGLSGLELLLLKNINALFWNLT